MKFGLFGGAIVDRDGETADSQGYSKLIDMAIEAEASGFHSIFLVEHHFSGSGQISASLNLLTYLAAKTTTLRLGTAVTVLPWHNPVLIAEQAATIDVLSGGRLDLGVGKGYRQDEFDAFMIPKDEAQARFDESVALIQKAWTATERFDHDGKYWQLRNVLVDPPCVQAPHPPLWTAAGTDESIARVAKSGFNLLLDHFATDARTEERIAVWRGACAEAGRPLDPMAVAVARGLTITRTQQEYEDAVAARIARNAEMAKSHGALPGLRRDPAPSSYAVEDMSNPDSALIGDPDTIIQRLHKLKEMGFGYVLILLPRDIATLRAFADEVMPAFADDASAAAAE